MVDPASRTQAGFGIDRAIAWLSVVVHLLVPRAQHREEVLFGEAVRGLHGSLGGKSSCLHPTRATHFVAHGNLVHVLGAFRDPGVVFRSFRPRLDHLGQNRVPFFDARAKGSLVMNPVAAETMHLAHVVEGLSV